MAFSEYDQHDAVGLAECVAQGEVSPEELLEHFAPSSPRRVKSNEDIAARLLCDD